MPSWSTNSSSPTISSPHRFFMLDAPTPDDLTWSTAGDLAAEVTAGRLKALEIVEVTLARIRARDPLLNSFTTVTEQRARDRARALDEAHASGKPLGPLAGVPFAVKNLFDIAEVPTIAGSKINREKEPAGRDAAVIERLEHAGAVLVGALNMGEYAYDFTGENIHDGPSHNPHGLKRMTGGSSGGCGGAVAGGLVPLALGSDTNGSIRVPSSCCGIFGLKPTYGRLSRARSFPFVASLDHVGRWREAWRIWRLLMMPCRVSIPTTRLASTVPRSRSLRSSREAPRGCASPSRAVILKVVVPRSFKP